MRVGSSRELLAGRFAVAAMSSFVQEMRAAGQVEIEVYQKCLSTLSHLQVDPSQEVLIEVTEDEARFAIEALHDCVFYSDDGHMEDIHDMFSKQVGYIQSIMDGQPILELGPGY